MLLIVDNVAAGMHGGYMKHRLALACGLALASQNASAQICASYVGQPVAPRDIDEVMAPFIAVGTKSEFESTEQYATRKASAVSKLGGRLIIKKAPEDRKYLTYDADTQRLDISSFAFRNLPFDSSALFGPGAPHRGVMESSSLNIEVVIEQDEKITGTYDASNSFGAKTIVSKMVRRTRGVFESKTVYGQDAIFPAAQVSNIAGSISMTPQDAMRLKPTLQFAYVVAPKAPYFLSARDDVPSRPTLNNPFEITTEVSALIADIQCGLVLDPGNVVLAAFETR